MITTKQKKKQKQKEERANLLQSSPVSIRRNEDEEPVPTTYGQVMIAAQNLLEAGNDAAAVYFLRQLSSRFRKEPQPLIGLLNAYMIPRRFDDAVLIAQKLLKRFPANASALVQVAMLYHLIEQPEQAITFAKRAQRLQPKNTQALETLAIIFQSTGDNKKAIDYYDRAVEIEPRNVMLLFGKSRAINAPAPQEFILHVESLLHSSGLTDQQKGLLHFSLAWLYEKIDADVHFHHLKMANSFVAIDRHYPEGKAEALFEENVARFSKGSIADLQQYGNHSVNPIFISSLPRSGSTLLENMLGAHTETYRVGESGAIENALNLSGFDVSQFQAAASPGCLGGYPETIAAVGQHFLESRMIAEAGDRKIVDKSISNYNFVGAILMAFPNAKIINLRRHPLDIIYSCYQQHFASGHNYTYSLKALAEMYAVYVRQMAFWEELFPDSIFNLSYEQLVSDPAATLKELLEFCDLPWQPDCLDYHSSLGTITTASDQQVRKRLYRSSVHKWQRVEVHLQPVIDLLGELADYDPGQNTKN